MLLIAMLLSPSTVTLVPFVTVTLLVLTKVTLELLEMLAALEFKIDV
jgi:hypothetical protein